MPRRDRHGRGCACKKEKINPQEQPSHNIAAALEELVGKCCTELYGGSWGSHVSILLGPQRTQCLEMTLHGENRSIEISEADFEIIIRDTEWILRNGLGVLVTDQTPAGYGGDLYWGLQQLIGKEVTSVAIGDNGDLSLNFTNGLALMTRCRRDLDEDELNYLIVLRNREITVGPDAVPNLRNRSKR